MIAYILLNSLLQKQFADSISEHTEDGFERFSKDLRQEVSGVFALQITAVKHDCFCNKFVLRAVSVTFAVFLYLLQNRILHPNCVTTSLFCFHIHTIS